MYLHGFGSRTHIHAQPDSVLPGRGGGGGGGGLKRHILAAQCFKGMNAWIRYTYVRHIRMTTFLYTGNLHTQLPGIVFILL